MYNKNFSKEPTDRQKIGSLGESLACEYLSKLGFVILDRNYYKKWGEIDIVAKLDKKVYFVEVKTITRDPGYVTYETGGSFRAEDNVHPWKLQRMSRVIQSYLIDKNVSDETDWQFDVVTVVLDKGQKLLNIDRIEDIVL